MAVLASSAFDTDQSADAAARWRVRAAVRDANAHELAQGRFDAVETPDRMAKRVNRLLATLAPEGGDADALPSALAGLSGRQVTPAEMSDNRLYERVIGATRDFLFVEFLQEGEQAARAVGRISTQVGSGQVAYGTGFLVSPDLMLTNHHVLDAPGTAADSVFELDYARDGWSRTLPTRTFDLQPDRFFLTDKDLDFALVAVAPTAQDGTALAAYGWLPLIAAEGKINVGENVNVVQHPKGELKQVVVRDGKLIDLPHPTPPPAPPAEVPAAEAPVAGPPPAVAALPTGTPMDAFAYYTADTEPGSSGSPVFNDQWEVVALHHTAIPRTNPAGDFLDVDGAVWTRGDDPARLDYVANEGVRISRLAAFLRGTSVPPAFQPLLDAALAAPRPPPPDAAPLVGAAPAPAPLETKAAVVPAAPLPAPPAAQPLWEAAAGTRVTLTWPGAPGPLSFTLPVSVAFDAPAPAANTPSQPAEKVRRHAVQDPARQSRPRARRDRRPEP